MKQSISTAFITILILFNMETQAQSFKTIEAKNLNLQVYNASENSFGAASVMLFPGQKPMVFRMLALTLV
ncbi:hypothetical protein [Flavobacterium piscis]|uniref:Uncharacterized protein n=1 Tax=Flavobacterium piscis TaxID=1114874 RepID=A0ABU1YDU0_9FLAO|nr:hypothetical protein [Flavobacterium piscis]MDR7212399.1 hypothetical protein [Flavobacterium piscis]